MSKFKLGDRVKSIENSYGTKDKLGTVIAIECFRVGVEFDECVKGHNCSTATSPLRKGKWGHCWWLGEHQLEKLNEKSDECIVIYRKDREVFALDKSTGKKAVAKCSPEDTFDFKVGAKLAFERLMYVPKIVKQDKYKVGDKVKIVDKFTPDCYPNPEGYMNKYLGTVMTIEKVYRDHYEMKEDKGDVRQWSWYPDSIEGKVVGKIEPKKVEEPVEPFPPGTLVKVNTEGLPKGIIGEIVEKGSIDYLIDFKVEYPGCYTGEMFAKKPLPKRTGRWILPEYFERVGS